MSSPEALIDSSSTAVANEPWYLTATFWKRFSVLLSIVLSATGLILSSIASLRKQNADQLKALTVAGIVINGVSIALSALTSLDWQSKSTHEKKFAQQLMMVTHVHEGSRVAITAERKMV